MNVYMIDYEGDAFDATGAIVAPDEETARQLAWEAIVENGLDRRQTIGDITITKVDLTNAHVITMPCESY